MPDGAGFSFWDKLVGAFSCVIMVAAVRKSRDKFGKLI